MITINIDNLEKYDISQLEKILNKTVHESMRKLFGDDQVREDDYFYYENKRACSLVSLGFEDYFITVDGEVYRTYYNSVVKKLKPIKLSNRWCVTLCQKQIVKRYNLHFLMATYFVEKPDSSYKKVRFIDGNEDNYRADNLEWVKKLMRSCGNRKKIAMCDLDGNVEEIFETMEKAHIKYGYNSSNISKAIHGEYKTSYNHIWKYV